MQVPRCSGPGEHRVCEDACNLAKHAWQTRDRQRRIKKSPAKTEDREPPEITSYHFEVDGQVVEAPGVGDATAHGISEDF